MHLFCHEFNVLLAGEVAAGTIIGTLLGKVVHLSFCASDERVAACSGTTVHVLSSKARNDADLQTTFPTNINIYTPHAHSLDSICFEKIVQLSSREHI